MSAEKLDSLPVLRKPRGVTTKPQREYAEIIFAVAIVFQVIFMILTRKKIAVDSASLFSMVVISTPVLALLVARTWRRAAVYSLLCTLATPIVMSVTVVIVAFAALMHRKDLAGFLTSVGRGFFLALQVWLPLFAIWVPWLIGAAILRFAYEKIRTKF